MSAIVNVQWNLPDPEGYEGVVTEVCFGLLWNVPLSEVRSWLEREGELLMAAAFADYERQSENKLLPRGVYRILLYYRIGGVDKFIFERRDQPLS